MLHSTADLAPFTGEYRVDSRAPDATPHIGRLLLEPRGLFLHATTRFDDGVVRHGLAMPFAGRLVMTFGPLNKVEIGAYRIEGPSMDAIWVPPGADQSDFAKCGREQSESTGPGVWTIKKAHAIDGSAYTGNVNLTPDGPDTTPPKPVRFVWDLHDGQYKSFGLMYPDALYTTFSFEPEKPYGVAVYEGSPAAGFSGVFVTGQSLTKTPERLSRP